LAFGYLYQNSTHMGKFFFTVLCLHVFIHSFAQQEDSIMIRRIADEILINGKAYDNLHDLTKKIGGRLSASPQYYNAEQWGLNTMQQSGSDKVWLQECMIPHWIRGGIDKAEAKYNAAATGGRNFISGKKSLDVIALGNSIGTGLKGITANVIEVKSFDDLEAKKDEIKDKIVFYNYKFNPTFIRTFQAYGDAVQYRGSGPSRAAKYGALAVIVRSMTHSTDNNPHTGSLRYDTTLPKIPAVAIGLKDADWLSAQLENKKVEIFLKTGGKFLPDTIGHNVIGELTGTEFPDQIVTIGGHLDSWDPAEGAHDDGAGVVHTIEVLRVFKALGYKPKHTIRFVLFSNEENGLRGGSKYADEAKAKNEKHIFALESDAGGFTPRGFSFGGTTEQLKKAQSWIPLLYPYGVYEITGGGGGADIGPLNENLKTPVAELAPDSQRYFDYHHARNDVFENVNKRELELGAINMAALIYLVDKYGL
jgi:carboxypeptidase Q